MCGDSWSLIYIPHSRLVQPCAPQRSLDGFQADFHRISPAWLVGERCIRGGLTGRLMMQEAEWSISAAARCLLGEHVNRHAYAEDSSLHAITSSYSGTRAG